MINQTKAKQNLLERFVAKGIGFPYYFNNISKDTGLDIEMSKVLCKQMADMKYLDITQSEASLRKEGHVFYHAGGFERLFVENDVIKKQNNIPKTKLITDKVISLWIKLSKNPTIKWLSLIAATLISAIIYDRLKNK